MHEGYVLDIWVIFENKNLNSFLPDILSLLLKNLVSRPVWNAFFPPYTVASYHPRVAAARGWFGSPNGGTYKKIKITEENKK